MCGCNTVSRVRSSQSEFNQEHLHSAIQKINGTLDFLHDFTLFVIDKHQIMLTFPTLFDHFHFHGTGKLVHDLKNTVPDHPTRTQIQ